MYLNKLLSLFFSRTAKNTYFVFVGNVFGLIFALLFTIITFRLLSHSDYGYLSALWAMLLLVSDIADVGIGSSLSRFLPPLEKQQKRLYSFLKTAFILQAAVAVLFFTIFFLFSSIIAESLFHNQSLTNLVRITAVGIFGFIIVNFFFYTLSARQQFKHAAVMTVLNGGLRLLFLVAIYYLFSVSLFGAVWAQSISYFFLIILGFYFVKFSFLSAIRIKGDLKKLVSFSSYLGVARSLTAVASRLDILMLFALLTSFSAPYEAGIYSGAARFIAPFPLFAGSFSTVIAPKLATLSDREQLKIFIKKVILATLGLIFSIFILMAIARPFLFLILGEKSEPSVPVLQLLLVSQIFFVASIPSVNLAIYHLKKPYILTLNAILQLVIVVLGNFIFIPRFNRFGPALSLIIAYLVTLVLTSYLSYYYFRKRHG
ncbi:hypothetical protein FJY90_02380 [Candidatus Gottesmanbacteria bacterium]|nr:hypothetical protein [Candidatus Gottesmanbacteria bacterium]